MLKCQMKTGRVAVVTIIDDGYWSVLSYLETMGRGGRFWGTVQKICWQLMNMFFDLVEIINYFNREFE